MRRAVLQALALTVAVAGFGQEPTRADRQERETVREITGPQLGLAFDERTGQLRRVLGMPGAAWFGPALDTEAGVTRAVISPRQDSALATTAAGEVIRFRINGEPERLNVPPAPDLMVYSPEGESAALHYGAAGRVEVLRLSHGSSRSIDVQALGPAFDAIAVADDGTALVAVSGGSVHIFEGDSGRTAGAVRHAAAAEFLSRSHDAVIADDAGEQIYLLRGAGFIPIAGPGEGVSGPVAVAPAADGKRVLVANGRSGTILNIGLEDGAPEVTECACRPSTLRRTAVPGVYWLNGNTLYDVRASERRIWFVPREGEPR